MNLRSYRPSLLALALASCSWSCATTANPQRAQAAVQRAQTLRGQGLVSDAAAAFDEALRLDPQNLSALRGYVETHHRLGRIRDAEARFATRVAASPHDAYAHAGLGLCWYAIGGTKAADAARALGRAVELAPDVPDLRYRYGLVLVDAGRWDEAIGQLEKAVAAAPDKSRYRLPYALALARVGRQKDAVAQLREILSLSPGPDEVEQAMRTGQSLADPFRGFPPAAREQFEKALEWLSHDSIAQAQQVLDSLAEKYPDLAIVHAMSGLCAAKSDDAGRAIVSLRKASELAPDLAEPRLFLGDLYNARGRPDEARAHYEAAIERNPFIADAYKRLAEGLLKTGDRATASDRFATYLLLRPEDLETHLLRATLESELQRPVAKALWDDLARRFPGRSEVLVGRARWYFARAVQATDPAERKASRRFARESLEQALELDAENPTAAAMLAELGRLKD